MENSLQKTKDNSIAIVTEKKYALGTNLKKEDIIQSSNISVLSKDIAIASMNVSIKNIPKKDSGSQLKALINLIIAESGYRKEIEDIKFVIIGAINDIFSDFGHLSLKEIEIAFKRGVRGLLGESYGISVAQMYKWLYIYDKELRINAMKELKKNQKTEVKEVSKDEIIAINDKWLRALTKNYYDFTKTKIFNYIDAGNIFYNLCDENKIFPIPKNIKKKYFNTAKENYLNQHNPEKAEGSYERSEFARIIKLVKHKDGFHDEIIKNRAKKLAVQYIFEKFIETSTDFETTIRTALKTKIDKI